MMPKEWWPAVWIAAFFVYQVRPVLIHSVVHSNGHLLGDLSELESCTNMNPDAPSFVDSSSHELGSDDQGLRRA